jgi:hypothetical protein
MTRSIGPGTDNQTTVGTAQSPVKDPIEISLFFQSPIRAKTQTLPWLAF